MEIDIIMITHKVKPCRATETLRFIRTGCSEFIQDGIKYRSVGNGNWYKVNRTGKGLVYDKCRYCGRLISNSGRASMNHYEMHKRRGDVVGI